jgi:hypothetical protein
MVSIRQDLLRLLKLFGINMRIFTDDYKSVSPEYKFLNVVPKGEYLMFQMNLTAEFGQPISTYAGNYNLFDISLAPLEDNVFNKVKSIKVIESGFHKSTYCTRFWSIPDRFS